MKYNSKITKFLVVGILSAQLSHAASLSVENVVGDGSELALVGTDGSTGLLGGFIALYQFSTAPTNVAALQANGNTGLLQSVALTSAVNFGSPGAFIGQFNSFQNNANADLFLIFGDGADAASSSGLALIDVTGQSALTGNDANPGPQSLEGYIIDNPADVLIGTVGTGIFDWSAVAGDQSFADYATGTVGLEAVPEPSSALLLGLGFLAAGARRRR